MSRDVWMLSESDSDAISSHAEQLLDGMMSDLPHEWFS